MAKILSERTAEWIKKQINARDIRAKKRPAGSAAGGAASIGGGYIIATVDGILGGGVYQISYELVPGNPKTSTTKLALLLANNLVSSAEYNVGDKILVHQHEFDVAPGGEQEE